MREYVENMYGETDSPLHRGIGTDRFVALWLLDTPRVQERLEEGRPPPRAGEVGGAVGLEAETSGEVPVPGSPRLDLDAEAILVAVPAEIQALKERSMETAVAWREATRRTFVHYLTRGWEGRELLRPGQSRVAHYLLRREGDR